MAMMLLFSARPTHVSYTDTSCTAAETETRNVGKWPADLCEAYSSRRGLWARVVQVAKSEQVHLVLVSVSWTVEES